MRPAKTSAPRNSTHDGSGFEAHVVVPLALPPCYPVLTAGAHIDAGPPIQTQIPRPIHVAHAALADLGGDLGGAEPGTDFERHRLLGPRSR